MAVALTRVEATLPSTGALIAACRRIVPLEPGLGLLLVLGFLALGFLVVALGARSLVRQLRAQRRFLRALEPVATVEAGGQAVTLIESETPHAFCAGLLRPRIYLSTAARELLSEAELRAVVAHEAHHRANRDPLKILLSRVLAESLFFLPSLRRLGQRYGELTELAADEAATRIAGGPTLASALLAFGEQRGPAGVVVGIAPERVDQLLGHGHRWQLPLSIFVGSLVILAALLGLVLSVPALLQSQSLSIATILAQGCMAAMVVVPVAMAVGAIWLSRTWIARCLPVPR